MAYPFSQTQPGGLRAKTGRGEAWRGLARRGRRLPGAGPSFAGGAKAPPGLAQKVLFEPLEPRLLLSADLMPFTVDMADANIGDDITLRLDSTTSTLEIYDSANPAVGPLVSQKLDETSEIVIQGVDDRDDTLTVEFFAPFFKDITYDGGAGGFDSLVINGGSFETVTYDVASPDSGTIDLDDGTSNATITFTGLEPTSINVAMANLVVEANPLMDPETDVIRIGDDAVAGNNRSFIDFEVGSGEDVDFVNPTVSLTVNALGGSDTFILDQLDSLFSASITLDGGGGSDTIEVTRDANMTLTDSSINVGGQVATLSGIEAAVLTGGDAANTIDASGFSGSATLSGGNDDDILVGGGGSDILTGGAGGDTLTGGAGSDSLIGGSDDDTYIFGNGFGLDSVTDTGGANDTLDFTAITDPPVNGTLTFTVQPSGAVSISSGAGNTVSLDATNAGRIETLLADTRNIALGAPAQAELLAGLEQLVDWGRELAGFGALGSELPLIGKNVGAAAGAALDIAEALDQLRLQVKDFLDSASGVTVGDLVDELNTRLTGVGQTIAHLGPAIVSDVLSPVIAAGDAFSFDLTLDGVTTPISASGVTSVSALVDALNAQLGSAGLSESLSAVENSGRVAFEVVSSEVEDFALLASGAAVSKLGFPSAQAVLADVQDILDDLGSLNVKLTNAVGLSVAFTNLVPLVSLDVDYEANRDSEFNIDFGTNSGTLGLAFEADAKLDVSAGLDFDFDLKLNLDDDPDFFVDIDTLGATVELNPAGTPNVDARLDIGFLTTRAVGTLQLDAGVAVTVADPTGGPGLSITDLNPSNVAANVSLDARDSSLGVGTNPSFSVDLAVTAEALGSFAATGTIQASGDPFSGRDIALTLDSNFENNFTAFNNLSAGGVIGLLGQLSGFLEDFRNSDFIDGLDIPFAQGSLSRVLDFAEVLSDALLFDNGADNQADGSDKLVTDINTAIADAGLADVIRAQGDGTSVTFVAEDSSITELAIVQGESVLGFTDDQSATATVGLLSLVAAMGVANFNPGSQTVEFRITRGGSVENKSFTLDGADNDGVGDDAPKLLDANNAARFQSAQDLVTRLGEIITLGVVGYDSATQVLTYEIDFADIPLLDVSVPIDFQLDLAPLLTVESDTSVVLSADADFGLILGFDLSDNPAGSSGLIDTTTTLDSLNVEVQDAPAITADGEAAAVVGQLTDDATFTVTVNGTDTEVVVPVDGANGTGDNQTITNLVSDVNAALGVAGLSGQLTAQADGNKIQLVAAAGVTSLSLTADSADPAVRELGFGQSQTAADDGGTLTLTAQKNAPSFIGRFDSDVSFDVTIDSTTTEVTLEVAATEGNRNILDLVGDVNRALSDAGLGALLEADSQGMGLILTRIDGTAGGFSVAAAAGDATGLGKLGFTVGQASNLNDLVVTLSNGDQATVSLTGAATIGDVITAIETAVAAQTSKTVDVTISADNPDTPVDEAGTGLTLTENGTIDSADTFRVEAVNGSGAAVRLGILGTDLRTPTDTADGIIEGSAIAGVSLLDRFFIEDAVIAADFSLSTPGGINATAGLGFVGITLDGTGDLTGRVEAGLKTPGAASAGGRVTLNELIGNVGNIGEIVALPTFTGSGSLELDVGLDPDLPDIPLLNTNPGPIVITIADLGNPLATTTFNGPDFSVTAPDSFTLSGDRTGDIQLGGTVTVDLGAGPVNLGVTEISFNATSGLTEITVALDGPAFDLNDFVSGLEIDTPVLPDIIIPQDLSFLGDIGQFDDIGFGDILDGLLALSDFLSEFESFGFLNDPIPLINKSVNDLLGFADDFAQALEEIQNNPAGTLQLLESKIKESLGLSESALDDIRGELGLPASDIFSLSLDAIDPTILRLDLNLGAAFSEGLDLDLPDLNLGDLSSLLGPDAGSLFSLTGSAGLFAEGSIAFTLGLGIDLDDPGDVYLFDNTALEGELSVGGDGLAFSIGLGPFGLTIQPTDDDPTTSQANITASASAGFLPGVFTDGRALLTTAGGVALGGTAIGDALTAELLGTIEVDLPTFFPTDSNQLGTIQIDGELQNIGNLVVRVDPGDPTPADAIVVDLSDVIPGVLEFDLTDLSLFDGILLAVDGFDLLLGGIQDIIDGVVGNLNLPLIGDELSSAARFIEDFRDGFLESFRQGIESIDDAARDFADADKNIISTLLFDLLGPGGINLLKPLDEFGDNDSAGDFINLNTNLDDILDLPVSEVEAALQDAEIEWDFSLGTTLLDVGADIGFDLGIPGLGLETEGDINLALDWELDLGFGLSFQDGFFFKLNDDLSDPELSFTAVVDIPATITGTLGFLQVTAADETLEIVEGDASTARNTGLSATIGLDIKNEDDPSDGRLSLSEFGKLDFDVTLQAEAAATLALSLGISDDLVPASAAAGFPEIVSDFVFFWQLDTVIGEGFGNAIAEGLEVVEFRDVSLDLGSYLTEVIGPVLEEVQKITEPLQPLIDFLTTPFPVLSDLGLNITPIDLAKLSGDPRVDLILAIVDIVSFVNTIGGLTGGDNLLLNFGEFTIFDKDIAGTGGFEIWDGSFDPQSVLDSGLDLITNLVADQFGDAPIIGDVLNSVAGAASDALAEVAGASTGGFAFPIIEDPSQIFGLLLGDPAVLITYDLPPLELGFEFTQFFSIIGPLGVSITLGLEAVIDFAFGYDTLGIQQFVDTGFRNPLLLFEGFFVSDTDLPTGAFGTDVDEVTISGTLQAAAELNLGVARGGVAGGVFIDIFFDLFDPNSDGRVRISEIFGNIENQLNAPNVAERFLAPLAPFDVSGEIFARLFAFVEVDLLFFSLSFEQDITPPITILEFDIDFFRPPFLASEQANGDLLINVGDFAAQRLLGDTRDIGESIVISGGAGGEVTVSALNLGSDATVPQGYTVGSGGKIIIVGAEGDDTFNLSGLSGIQVEIDGGAGNDSITLGAGVGDAVIHGGTGDDTITGGGGNDVIFGGAGNDTLMGGGGDDLIFGDEGEPGIEFFGSAGGPGEINLADILAGIGSRSTDFLRAPENGFIDGEDTISGGAGDDILFGSGGADEIDGDGGADIVLGEGGLIEIVVRGDVSSAGGNTLADSTGQFIELDPDDLPNTRVKDLSGAIVKIVDGTGEGQWRGILSNTADTLTLDSDWDITPTSSSSYVILEFAETDRGLGADDTLRGGSGDDIIFGGKGNDAILGEADDDLIFGQAGFDTIDAGGGDDLVFGDGGTFSGLAPAGPRAISGGDADQIKGGSGNDRLYGGDGGDTIEGGVGNDEIFGGAGADRLFGNLFSPTMTDGPDGTPGQANDRIFGEGGPDLISGGGGDDFLDGGAGSDQIFGDSGGLDPNLTFDPSAPTDPDDPSTVLDPDGDDTIIGGQGGDRLFGQGGSDSYRLQFQGGENNSLIEVADFGLSGIDQLVVTGTLFDDQFLLRANAAGTLAFIASINNDGEDVERINYNGAERITVNGSLGNDNFTVDDTAAQITLNGDLGDDTFQIGQLFRSARAGDSGTNAGIDDDDFFLTIETTRGFLSNGVSAPLVANGGVGEDNFIVFHNLATLQLNGGPDNDSFSVRAFALTGSQEPKRQRTDISGGAGADLVEYAVNAPVNIDGGDGLDTVTIIGTEFGDDFVITKDGVFGAGLNVNFVNIEALKVDGAEGDDRFFIQSTSEKFTTEIAGGKGSDTFNMSGDTPPVVSNDLRGHSGIITHGIESLDSNYNGLKLDGISTNVADNDEPFVVLTPSDGSTVITEGGATDSYTVVLTRKPTTDVLITVLAPIPTQQERELRSRAFRLDSPTKDQFTQDGTGLVLRFTADNWFKPQTVDVIADGAMQTDTAQVLTRPELGDSPLFTFDDAAVEGLRSGVINHTVTTEAGVFRGEVDSAVTGNAAPNSLTDASGGFTPGELVGRKVEITNGAGVGQIKFIVANTASTITIEGEWDPNDPIDSTSDYQVRIDDAIVGIGAAIDNVAFTFTDTNADFPIEGDGLAGAKLFIVGGTGVGQERLILSNSDQVLTLNGDWSEVPDSTSIYRIERFEGVAVRSIEVQIHDNDRAGLIVSETGVDTSVIENSTGDQISVKLTQAPTGNVTVQLNAGSQLALSGADLVNGNQLVFDSTNWNVLQIVTVDGADDGAREGFHSDLITFEMITGSSDQPVVGLSDSFTITGGGDPTFLVGLTNLPSNVTSVTLDGAAVPNFDVATDSDPLSFQVVQNKIVFFNDAGEFAEVVGEVVVTYDIVDPGFITAVTPPILARIADDDAPSVLIRETGGSTDVIEFTEAVPILSELGSQTLTNVFTGQVLTFDFVLPGGFLADGDAVLDITAVADLDRTDEFLTLSAEGTFLGNLFQFGGSQGGELSTSLTISQADLATLAADGTISFTVTPSSSVNNLFFSERLTLNLSVQGTLVADAAVAEADAAGFPRGDTYEVVLTAQPDEDVRITVTPEITKTTRTGGIRHDLVQVAVSSEAPGAVNSGGTVTLLFTPDNWDTAQVVNVTAVDDQVVDGGDTKVFAPGPDTLSKILGPVFIDGEGGEGSLAGLGNVVLLPGETNLRDSTGDVVELLDRTLTVELQDLIDQGIITAGTEVSELLGKTAEITRGGATDQFRLIIEAILVPGSGGDPDTVELLLNDSYEFEADDPPTEYAITTESLNFFVDEAEQVDFMFLFDNDSPADSSGTIEASRITGFNMGPDIEIGGILQPGGITYNDLEVITINLGSGNNNVTVGSTHARPDGFQTWTILNTGGNFDDGNDQVTIDLTADETPTHGGAVDASGSSSVTFSLDGGTLPADDELVGQFIRVTEGDSIQARRVVGNTVTDGMLRVFVDDPWDSLPSSAATVEVFVPADGAFAVNTQDGDDIVDGSSSTRSLVIFGGAGADMLTGGSGDDVIFGDNGRVDYFDENGKVVTRLGSAPDVIIGPPGGIVETATATTLVDEQASFPEGNALVGFSVTITDGTGVGQTRTVTGNTATELTVDSAWTTIPDGTSQYRVLTLSATADSLSDGQGTFPDNAVPQDLNGLSGLEVVINNGTGFLQDPRIITGNDATTLFVAPDWDVLPDDTSDYRISTTPEDQTDGVVRGAGLIATLDPDVGGDDMITGGAGDDTILGGAGGDTIIGGVGGDEITGGTDEDLILGDHGRIDLAQSGDFGEGGPAIGDSAPTVLQLVQSFAEDSDGVDDITGGEDRDIVIGGGAGDFIDAFGGDGTGDIVLGDHGEGEFFANGVLKSIKSTNPTIGGVDEIIGGDGPNILVGGDEGDEITGGGVNDTILGDNGEAFFTEAGVLTLIQTTNPDFGGEDEIRAGNGSDVVLGGSFGDLILAGGVDDARDVVIGDNGIAKFTTAGVLIQIATASPLRGGDDEITTGNGPDVVLGGSGNDVILAAIGADEFDLQDVRDLITDREFDLIDPGDDAADILVGDNGSANFDSVAVLLDIQTSDPAQGGKDIIIGGNGPDVIFGGSDDDTIVAGGDDDAEDFVLGDNGRATFEGTETFREGEEFSILSFNFNATSSNRTVTGVAGTPDVPIAPVNPGQPAPRADNWNNLTSDGPLTFGDNAGEIIVFDDGEIAPGVTIEWGQDLNFDPDDLGTSTHSQISPADDDDRLFEGYLDTSRSHTIDVNIAGLANHFDSYDIYVYLDADDQDSKSGTSVRAISDGTTTFYLNDADGNTFTGTYVNVTSVDPTLPGVGNYVVFRGLTGDAASISIDDDQSLLASSRNRPVINGLQLVGHSNPIDRIESTDPSFGGDDIILTGGGADIAIGGIGGDRIDTFGPAVRGEVDSDVVVGDNGSATFMFGELREIRTTYPDVGNINGEGEGSDVSYNDIIRTGNGEDLVLGGLGDDNIRTGVEGPFDNGDVKVLSFNFNSDVAKGVVTGVAGAVQADNWNNLPGSGDGDDDDDDGLPSQIVSNVVFDSGDVASDVSIRWGGNLDSSPSALGNDSHSQITNPGTQNERLFEGYQHISTRQTLSADISGLNAHFQTYDVYVYIDADNGRSQSGNSVRQITDGTDTFYLNDARGNTFAGEFVLVDSPDPSAPETGNYVVFRGLTDDVASIRMDDDGTLGTSQSNRPAITAIQVVGTPAILSQTNGERQSIGEDGIEIVVGGDFEGDNVIGDNGIARFLGDVVYELVSTDLHYAGNDTINTGEGPDNAIGGSGDDVISTIGALVQTTQQGDPVTPTDEVQTVTVYALGGTFTLTFDGDTTAAIDVDATAVTVATELEALPGIGTGNVSVVQADNVYTISFVNALAGSNVAELVVDLLAERGEGHDLLLGDNARLILFDGEVVGFDRGGLLDGDDDDDDNDEGFNPYDIQGIQLLEDTVGGNDTLEGGRDQDLLYGQFGNDTYVFNGLGLGTDFVVEAGLPDTDDDGDDMFNAGGRPNDLHDRFDFSGFDGPVFIDLGKSGVKTINGGVTDGDVNLRLKWFSNKVIEDLVGTEFSDFLEGNFRNNVIMGLGGNDFIFGRAGNDVLLGGDGNDKIGGGGGNDIIDGGPGNDVLHGDGGDDVMLGGDGDDIIRGQRGNDFIDGEAGNDILEGRAGRDVLLGGLGDDILRGQQGDDQVEGGEGNDSIVGDEGARNSQAAAAGLLGISQLFDDFEENFDVAGFAAVDPQNPDDDRPPRLWIRDFLGDAAAGVLPVSDPVATANQSLGLFDSAVAMFEAASVAGPALSFDARTRVFHEELDALVDLEEAKQLEQVAGAVQMADLAEDEDELILPGWIPGRVPGSTGFEADYGLAEGQVPEGEAADVPPVEAGVLDGLSVDWNTKFPGFLSNV